MVGVLAHEFAHVLQYVRGNNLPTKLKELHADFLAGYYLGRKRLMSGAVERFARALFEMGDFEFWNPNHHGTPQERVQAMSAGYIAGKSGASIHEAYKLGIEHVVMSSSYSDYVICSKCKGTKKIRVIERCSSCGGHGRKSCYRCKGRGQYYTHGPYGYGLHRCSVCKGGGFFAAQDAKARAGSLLTVEYAIFVTEKEECEGDKAGSRSIYMESQEKVKDKIKNRAPPTLPPVKAVPSLFYSG